MSAVAIQVGRIEVTRLPIQKLDGSKEIHWTGGEFEILADATGIELMGLRIESHAELEEFARLVSKVWTDHRALAPKILMLGEQGDLPL